MVLATIQGIVRDGTYGAKIDAGWNADTVSNQPAVDLNKDNLDTITRRITKGVKDPKDVTELSSRIETRVATGHLQNAENSTNLEAYWGAKDDAGNSIPGIQDRSNDVIFVKDRALVQSRVDQYAAKRVSDIQALVAAQKLSPEDAVAQIKGIKNEQIRNACLRTLTNEPKYSNLSAVNAPKFDVTPKGANNASKLGDVLAASDSIADPVRRKAAQDRDRANFLQAHLDQAADQGGTLEEYLKTSTIAADVDTVDAIRSQSRLYAANKAGALMGEVTSGKKTFGEIYKDAQNIKNPTIRDAVLSELQQKPEYKSIALNSKFGPSEAAGKPTNKTPLFTSVGGGDKKNDPEARYEADIDKVIGLVKGSEAYNALDEQAKAAKDFDIEQIKAARENQRKIDIRKNILAHKEQITAERKIGEMRWAKLKIYGKYAWKGAIAIGIAGLVIGGGGAALTGNAASLLQAAAIGGGVGVLAGAVGGSVFASKWDSGLAQLDEDQEKMRIKVLESNQKIIDLKRTSKEGEETSVDELFGLLKK